MTLKILHSFILFSFFYFGPLLAKSHWVEGEVLVKANKVENFEELLSSLVQSDLDLKIKSKINSDWYVLSYKDASKNPENYINSLKRELPQGLVSNLYFQPNYLLSLALEEKNYVMKDPKVEEKAKGIPGKMDPRAKELWGMKAIEADTQWLKYPGSYNVIVANTDTGIDYNHEDLRHNLWENTDSETDELHVGYDFVDNDVYPFDRHGHGTHTAGTIGAQGFNGLGIIGVNSKVTIMTLKFIDTSVGTTVNAIRSLDYAVKNGARVINASWGAEAKSEDELENKALKEAVSSLSDKNVLLVIAAGNSGLNIDERVVYPAGFSDDHILSVASINQRNKRSFYSNYGYENVDVAAPGSNILSTMPGSQYEINSGTSMAAPHVSGLAALLLSIDPTLSALELKDIILSTAVKNDSLKGRVKTEGVINVRLAIESLLAR